VKAHRYQQCSPIAFYSAMKKQHSAQMAKASYFQKGIK